VPRARGYSTQRHQPPTLHDDSLVSRFWARSKHTVA
jgi:hypothetical protein